MDFRRPTDSSSLATIANELSIAIHFGGRAQCAQSNKTG